MFCCIKQSFRGTALNPHRAAAKQQLTACFSPWGN